MTTSAACPSVQELVRLALGTTDPATAGDVGRHVIACPTCLSRLRELKTGDTLIGELEAADAGHAIDSLIRRLEALAPAPSLHYTLADSGPRAPVLPPPPPPRYPFLDPPRDGNELGWVAHYRVVELLGAGGMGLVFRAEDVHLQRDVALKVMRPELLSDPTASQRFTREARAAAAIRHENIVTIYQVGQQGELPFLAMELLEGESLEALVERQGRLSVVETLRIGRQVAGALAAAHDKGLIHRDIKPANLWLETRPADHGTSVPGGLRVKVLDFGLARPISSSAAVSGSGLIVGTPKYMAPEQARAAPVDTRSDLFSLGAVLYRVLAGSPAFDGADTLAVLTALAVRDPVPLSQVRPDIPPALAKLIHRLLAKRPEERPQSAGTVANTLREIEQATVHEPSTIIRRARPTTRPLPRLPRSALPLIAALAATALVLVLWQPWRGGPTGPSGPPIKVGVLHSLSGTLAESGNSVADATQLAIEEINQRGGLLGRPVEAVLRDGQSDWPLFGREAERLITEDRVSAIFGCWTSASRKEVVPIVEKHDHLLLYPVQYEGLEQSPNVLYCGAAPNQQILPAVRYAYGFLGKRKFFLVGSDYVFPRVANAIIRDEIKALRGEVVGEEYIPLGSGDVSEVVRRIREANPDAVLNTINGDSNRPFFRALRAAGVTPAKTPTVSFSIAEPELRSLGYRDMTGDYAAWNYFQSLNRPENADFVARFRSRFGAQKVTSDPMESAYTSVHLWAKAVEAAGTDEVKAVRRTLRGQSFEAPGGPVRVDPETQHLYKTFRLGQIMDDGQFEVIHSSEKPIRPEPFPPSRTRSEWEKFLNDLRAGWRGQWAKPD